MAWAGYALRVRSRQVCLVVGVVVISVAVIANNLDDAAAWRAIAAVFTTAASLCVVAFIFRFRYFWSGGAVFELRLREDAHYAARVETRLRMTQRNLESAQQHAESYVARSDATSAEIEIAARRLRDAGFEVTKPPPPPPPG